MMKVHLMLMVELSVQLLRQKTDPALVLAWVMQKAAANATTRRRTTNRNRSKRTIRVQSTQLQKSGGTRTTVAKVERATVAKDKEKITGVTGAAETTCGVKGATSLVSQQKASSGTRTVDYRQACNSSCIAYVFLQFASHRR
jgi:hypothetical protein